MLTIFSTAKPFRGGDLTRQRNALRSWTLVHPDCQVILFGDVPGACEVAAELGLDHVPDVLRSEYGSVRLDDMFARAQEWRGTICFATRIATSSFWTRSLERLPPPQASRRPS